MQIYIQDRSESTVATIGDFYEDMHKTLTSTGTGSYEFTVSKSEPGQEFLNVGNYVVLLDEQNKGHQFTITKVDQLHDEKTVYAEDASLQLLSKEARPWAKSKTAQPASYYFNKALKGTGWVIGVNQIANLTRTLEWTGWDTVLTRLLSIATEFDNAELDFHVELDRTNVVRKVVDIYKQVGAYRDDIQLVYGDTANDIQKTESTENFATAIEGIGSLVENTKEGEPEKHYDFSAISYDDGDLYSPKGDPKLYSRKAHEKWDGKYGYSERHFEYETKDPQELLNRSKTELKKRCEPEVNYEISIADGRLIDINKGDTVKIFDHTYNPELLLQARAVEVDKSYTDPSQNKAIFGNFLTLISNVDPRLLEIQKQISQLPKARTPYPWVRYADDDKGTGMSMFPAGKAYMATVWNYETAVPSDDPADYAEKWVLIKGEDGSDGTPGKPGADGKTPYLHTAYAWSADGTDRFTTVYPGGNLLTGTGSHTVIGTANNDYLSNETNNDFLTIFKGLEGQTVTVSVDYEYSGFVAESSQNRLGWETRVVTDSTVYFGPWYYPNNGSGSGRMSSTFVIPKNITAIGYASGYIQFSGTVTGTLSHLKLEKGSVPTPWTPSPLDDPEGAYPQFIGTYTDYISDDSTDPAKYTWSKLRGETGQKGDTGPRGSTGAKGATGPIGPQGPKGEPGSKDVPVTTVSAAQPTTAKNGDIWWVLNSADVATAMKVYTSGAWVDKKVDQSVLNIVTLNAVTINGSTINGSEFNTSYTGTLVDGWQGSSQQTLDKYGYNQTSAFQFFENSFVTRSEITNTGNIMMGYSKQSKYNPSQPWDNTEGSIYINPLNLDIGFTGADLSGDFHLSIQDAYQNSGSATYLNGWGSWNADYSLKVVRQGRMVTVWGYIKHNNSATITPFAQVPAWARPEQGILISAVTFNSKVDNPIASALVMNAETGKIGFNSGGQKGGYVCFSTTYVGGDV